MSKRKNILFIMFDQLRFDYLSCSGHKTLHTPNFDRVATEGVRFSRCYVQSPVCGASRMSFYTGRYVNSHGASWNNFPLKVGELTLGDHLRKCGVECWLVGKTHMKVDSEGLERLGLSNDNVIGARVSECGFDVYIRDDGLWGYGPDGFYDEKRSPYNEYLKKKGYDSENPWATYANSGISESGEIAPGWVLDNVDKPANIKESDSETTWLTTEAINFLINQKTKEPWLCHLSYIKPHWPYMVPAPYHNMFHINDIQPVQRDRRELQDPHPIFKAHIENVLGKAFSKDEVREKVIPAYMGLIKQCDDQLGRLLNFIEEIGEKENTIIILTSDHGDYLGDHWLGEKNLFHEPSVKVPLIIYDPSPEANTTRGTVCDELVESIDLAATFIEMAGGEIPDHIVEGYSLVPFLQGKTVLNWREYAISEFDYSPTPMAVTLKVKPKDARIFMVADKKWKFMHAEGGFRPMLFDLENDPHEYLDIASDPNYSNILDLMYDRLNIWSRRVSQRTTISDETIINGRNKSRRRGIVLGVVKESESNSELLEKYTGVATQDHRD